MTDTLVMNPDAKIYVKSHYTAVLKQGRDRKHEKEAAAAEYRRATFNALVSTADGVLGPETDRFVRRIAEKLAGKWEKPMGTVMGWVRNKVQFAHVRALCHCIRGPRKPWSKWGGSRKGEKPGPVEDGAALALAQA